MTPLTWNADVEQLAPGKRKTRVGSKWRNYLADGGWQAIDLQPRQAGGLFTVNRAPYSIELPTLANGWATLQSTNRFDIWSKSVMPDAPVGIQKRFTTASPVAGEALGNGVLFRLAFPDLMADRLVQCHEQEMRDLVVFYTEPPGNGPVEIPFEVDFGTLPILESTGHGQDAKEQDFKNDRDIDQGLSFTDGRFRGLKIKAPAVWDSTGRRLPIKIRGKVIGSRFVGKKVIPRSAFAGATYPVFTDTTSTFYPDPFPETTSQNRSLDRLPSSFADWATIRTGNAQTVNEVLCVFIGSYSIADQWSDWFRAWLLFDTSSLSDTETIDSAEIGVYGQQTFGDDFSDSIVIVASTPNSNTTLVLGDWTHIGSTAFSSLKSFGSVTTSGFNTFALNSSGLAAISKTGVSKFGMRSEADRANIEPTWASEKSSGALFLQSDQPGTSSDPYLEVLSTEISLVAARGQLHANARDSVGPTAVIVGGRGNLRSASTTRAMASTIAGVLGREHSGGATIKGADASRPLMIGLSLTTTRDSEAPRILAMPTVLDRVPTHTRAPLISPAAAVAGKTFETATEYAAPSIVVSGALAGRGYSRVTAASSGAGTAIVIAAGRINDRVCIRTSVSFVRNVILARGASRTPGHSSIRANPSLAAFGSTFSQIRDSEVAAINARTAANERAASSLAARLISTITVASGLSEPRTRDSARTASAAKPQGRSDDVIFDRTRTVGIAGIQTVERSATSARIAGSAIAGSQSRIWEASLARIPSQATSATAGSDRAAAWESVIQSSLAITVGLDRVAVTDRQLHTAFAFANARDVSQARASSPSQATAGTAGSAVESASAKVLASSISIIAARETTEAHSNARMYVTTVLNGRTYVSYVSATETPSLSAAAFGTLIVGQAGIGRVLIN